MGSKIEKKVPHIKHRFKFLKAVANPSEFTNIKWGQMEEGEEVIKNKTILVFLTSYR